MQNNDKSEHYPNAPLIEALVDIQVSMPATFNVELLSNFADSLKEAFPVKNDLYQLSTMMQFGADAANQRAERWKIMQDLQSKIFEIAEDVTVNKARTADKAFKAMDDYIRG